MSNHIKRWVAGASSSGVVDQPPPTRKTSKRVLIFFLAATLLIAAAVIGIVAGVKSSHDRSSSDEVDSHSIIKAACGSTRFPELCFETVKAMKVTSQKEVIEASLNITITTIRHNFFTVQKLSKKKGLNEREEPALHDCVETIDETLDELHEACVDFEIYPTKKSLTQHADDLKTLLSTAMTNVETCLDGFSHDDADKKVREVFEAGEKHVGKMCSNVLAMLTNLTDTDIAAAGARASTFPTTANDGRKLMEWPEGMTAADRKLLQSSNVTPNVVVAADGSGNYKTVSAAVAAAPTKSKTRYVTRIKAGVYRENVDVPKSKTKMFLRDGRTTAIITGSKYVIDGSTTFHSASVAAGEAAAEQAAEAPAGEEAGEEAPAGEAALAPAAAVAQAPAASTHWQ